MSGRMKKEEGEELTVVASEPRGRVGGGGEELQGMRMRTCSLLPPLRGVEWGSRDRAQRPHPAGAFPAFTGPGGCKVECGSCAAGTERRGLATLSRSRLLASGDLPASQGAGITGLSHRARPRVPFLRRANRPSQPKKNFRVAKSAQLPLRPGVPRGRRAFPVDRTSAAARGAKDNPTADGARCPHACVCAFARAAAPAPVPKSTLPGHVHAPRHVPAPAFPGRNPRGGAERCARPYSPSSAR
ncbi:uncharacterized protein LOC107968784 [Pan troglodytes]|uniref:uncharacterized protein LOC107968784 n=1 Tax=Pan troglodytes TaxID=9598 RepID=UPI0007DBA0A7|nr:uncharacterized protein LOC107968784 [Pan troglodytes]